MDKDNVALTAARLWAEAEMDKIPEHLTQCVLPRKEYRELLEIVYSLGVQRGLEISDSLVEHKRG